MCVYISVFLSVRAWLCLCFCVCVCVCIFFVCQTSTEVQPINSTKAPCVFCAPLLGKHLRRVFSREGRVFLPERRVFSEDGIQKDFIPQA